MSTKKFFKESREQSVIKAQIVEHYFDAWAGIIIGTQKRYSHSDQRIGYVDLFAGPGRYEDGALSTPLRVVSKALEKDDYAKRLLTIFNDKDEDNARSLHDALCSFPNIGRLKHKPRIWNEEVGDKIADLFEGIKTIPLLAFIDPWGYKGLSLRLVNAILRDWGCDCIFFFNYSRINAGLSNPLVRTHMEALFGEDRAESLSTALKPMTPQQREATIVEQLAQALRGHGNARYVLPFGFKNDTGRRTTHHLIFVTKHFKGYEVMKEIMAKASSSSEQGVPTFAYSPAADSSQTLLFSLNQPLPMLRASLLKEFAGRQIKMIDIYKAHSVDTPFIKRNYKAVLREMEDESAIVTRGRRSKRGFADYIVAHFPPR